MLTRKIRVWSWICISDQLQGAAALLLVWEPHLEYLHSRTAYRYRLAVKENEGTKNLPHKLSHATQQRACKYLLNK